MRYTYIAFLGLIFVLWGTGASAFEVREGSATYSLHTVSSFVDLLISRGIIPGDRAAQARVYANAVERIHAARGSGIDTATELSISASQLIEYSKLSFGRFEDIKGLVLLVRNTGADDSELVHRQACPVTYRIYDETGSEIFDSGDDIRCGSPETARYVLGAGQTRMFEVEHRHRDRALHPGVYRFELRYAAYGSDVRTVTIR